MRPISALTALSLLLALLAGCSGSNATRDMNAVQRFHLGMKEYNDEDYLDALQQFDVIRLQFPGSAVSDSARYFSGMSHYKREEYLLASYEFNHVRQGSPDAGLMADAQYMYAMSFVKLSPEVPLDQTYTVRAIDAMQTFIEQYPKHPRAKEADKYVTELINKLAEKEYNTAKLYLKLDNLESALIYFNSVIDTYYNTPYADDALYNKIVILRTMKHTGEEQDAIKKFLEQYPDSPYKDKVQEMRDPSTLTSAN